MSSWGHAWGSAWSDAWGPLAEPGVFSLGNVNLDLVGRTAVVGLVDVEAPEQESYASAGGPDDETLSPGAKKYLRERYKKLEPEAVPEVRPKEVTGDVRHLTPEAVDVAEQPAQSVDISGLIEQTTKAARQALDEVERRRVEEHNRRAIVALLAMIDD